MAKQFGDNLRSSIKRAGISAMTVTIDRGSGAVAEDFFPFVLNEIVEEMVYSEGKDGKIDVHYYEQRIDTDYVQTDEETMNDLFAAVLDSQFHTTGLPVAVTLFDGTAISLTMFCIRTPRGEGPKSAFRVNMKFKSTTDAPMLR